MNRLVTLLVLLALGGCGGKNQPPTRPLIQPEDSAPSWSSDGQWVAYVHFNPSPGDTTEPSGLYVTDAAGTSKRLVRRGFPRGLDWSPNGQYLVFNDDAGLHVITASGDSLRTIHSGGSYPSWSPDGTEIAFSTISGVWGIAPDGTGLRAITPADFPSGDADWSPDGRRMVLLGNRGSVGEEVFIFNLDAATDRPLTSDSNEDRSPAWSPQGDLIAWNKWPQDARGNVHPEVWLVDTLGVGAHKLVSAVTAPSWSPDGRFLVFSNQAAGAIRLFVIGVDGGGLRQLTY